MPSGTITHGVSIVNSSRTTCVRGFNAEIEILLDDHRLGAIEDPEEERQRGLDRLAADVDTSVADHRGGSRGSEAGKSSPLTPFLLSHTSSGLFCPGWVRRFAPRADGRGPRDARDHLQIGVEPNRIDVLTAVEGVEFAEAWAGREESAYRGVPISILSREHLIEVKRRAGRPQDRIDLEWLSRSVSHEEERRRKQRRRTVGAGAIRCQSC